MVNWQKLATFVEEQMTPVSALGNTHAQAPLHFGGIQRDFLDDVRDLISGRSRLSLLIFMRKRLSTRAGTVRRDRARSGIPGEGAGLKVTASASAEVLGLIGVVFLSVLTMRLSMLRVWLVARGCLGRLMVVEDQFTGRVVSFLREWQIRMENIPKILMM